MIIQPALLIFGSSNILSSTEGLATKTHFDSKRVPWTLFYPVKSSEYHWIWFFPTLLWLKKYPNDSGSLHEFEGGSFAPHWFYN